MMQKEKTKKKKSTNGENDSAVQDGYSTATTKENENKDYRTFRIVFFSAKVLHVPQLMFFCRMHVDSDVKSWRERNCLAQ